MQIEFEFNYITLRTYSRGSSQVNFQERGLSSIYVGFWCFTSVGFGVVVSPGIPGGEGEVVECEVPSEVPCAVVVMA